MAKSKPTPRILHRLFERAQSPVYFVSADYVITYANESCAEWVGLDRDALISASCVFSSQQIDEVQDRIQGLCPDPGVFASQSPRSSAAVWAQNSDGKKSWRAAAMHPFQDRDQNWLGVLVICQTTEHSEPGQVLESNAPTPSMDPRILHTTLAKIRTQTDRRHNLESLVGTSPFANRLRRQVKTAIESNTDLLITGPSGSGKEHLARTIHATRDPDHLSELLPVHCSIADQRLIQQNILDIVSSRTVVPSNQRDRSQDWLLLLDVDQLGEAAQHELLGFFQLPDFPLRTIATSADPLIEMAEGGAYSVDLAHHLSVMTIGLVTLSDRQADIPLLAQAIVERENSRREHPLSGFSNDVMQQFLEYRWPENLDQLNRTIQLATRNATTHQVTEADLPDEFRHALQAHRIGNADESPIQLDQFLGEIELELIQRALKQSRGNKTKAAKLLGINRPKLLRRLQHHGLQEIEPADPGNEELDSSAFEELD